MRQYLSREVVHTGFAVAVTVLVAVAAQLVGIGSFDDISLAGLAVTAVRSLATAIVTVFGRFVISQGG